MGTSINDLGQFGLVEHLTKDVKTQHPETLLGIGDDAAIIQTNDKQVVTTDILLEGIHFDLTYTPLKHLGYKAAIAAFSDVYAMNGYPKQLLVSLGVSGRFELQHLDELYEGIRLASDIYKVDLVGGDTSSSLTGLTIAVTCIGTCLQEPTLRSTAQVNDLVCVSGNLGAAFMGLQLLEREKSVVHNNEGLLPDFEGFDYILERQLKPEARKDIIDLFALQKIVPTAMIDLTNGLASDLLQICKASKKGVQLFEDKLPIDYQTAHMAENLNLNLSTVALNGGEDFELLFTLPLTMYDKIKDVKEISVIGHITEEKYGRYFITRDQQELELKAQGHTS